MVRVNIACHTVEFITIVVSKCIDRAIESSLLSFQSIHYFLDGSTRDDEDAENLKRAFSNVSSKRDDLLVALKSCGGQHRQNAHMLIAALESTTPI